MLNKLTVFVNVSHRETLLEQEVCKGHNTQTSNGAQRRIITHNSFKISVLEKVPKLENLQEQKTCIGHITENGAQRGSVTINYFM